MVFPGADLARQLRLKHPDLKIIFTSGYTAKEVKTDLLVKMNARFLPKPYTHADLAKTVRDCLDKANDGIVVAPL